MAGGHVMDLPCGVLLGRVALSNALAPAILSDGVGATVGHLNALPCLIRAEGGTAGFQLGFGNVLAENFDKISFKFAHDLI